ncbi:hypothetical protein [Neobacillus soli]|nr:hypothetical protein [Neobacillus soli]
MSLLLGMSAPLTYAAENSNDKNISLNGLIPETALNSQIEVKNGLTQPIYSKDDAIVEELYVTGDYNGFWDERNFSNNVADVKASVLVSPKNY